jgi:hypothetical protein
MKTRLTLSIFLIALMAWPALASPPLGRPGPASHDAIGVAGPTQAASDAMQSAYLDRGVVSDAYLYGADRLEALQNNDGGWDWELDDGDPNSVSPRNTIGPIGKGLARAYLHTLDADHLTALGQAGALLLTKTNNFSPSDGYLAAQLDAIFGGTTYVDYVTANFYGPLADGDYDRLGLGTLYTTATYVQFIRDNRTGSQANLAAWDIGMGLVGALAAGANPADWIAGVEAEINELDGVAYYDVIGLAGALYGLAAAGAEFDPTAGEHAAASNLADLAAILASYQIAGGGFAWNSDYVIPNDSNETIQETAYAILALDAVNPTTYATSIEGASLYMLGVQLATGGWENYPTSGENNEITAEALWGIDAAGTEITEVWVDDDFNSSTPGWGVTHFASIQDGIDAVSGSTVNVAAGTYPEALNVNKSVTLLGANAGVHPAVGTHPTEVVGTRGPESELSHNGLYALLPGADGITVDGFLFSGDGGRIIDTYVDANGFHLTNCIFENDATASTQGVIQFGGGSHTGMILDFNLFQDDGDHTLYTGGGPYDGLTIAWNKFNVEGDAVFWAASPLVDGVIQGNEFDGTIDGTPGTGFCTVNIGQAGNLQVLDNWVHHVQFSAFQAGIVGGAVSGNLFENIYPYPGAWGDCFELWGGQYGTAVSSDVTFDDNVFHFNDVAGQSVPVHGVRLRAPETGSGIDGTTIVFRDNQFLDGYERTDAVAIWHQGDTSQWADAIDNWWGHASGPYHATLNPGGLGARVGDYVTFEPWTGQATISVAASTNGPINCSQSSTLTFTYTPGAETPALRGYSIRVPKSDYLAFTAADFHYNPALHNPSGGGAPGGADSFFLVTLSGDGLAYIVDYGILGTTPGIIAAVDLFTLVVDGYASGAGIVAVQSCSLRDLDNQPIGADFSDAETILVDCAAPGAVTDLSATTGHQKVTLNWDVSGVGETAALEVWRAVWHEGPGFETVSAYPEYDDLANDAEPTVPASRAAAVASAEWGHSPVATLPSGDVTHDDNVVARGIYYYVVIPVDLAGNPGPPSTMVRAKNYHLGDVQVAYDGDVDTGDVTVLGAAYGLVPAIGSSYAHCDVGPTTNAQPSGFPLTDDVIGFEDLMIFALNYGNVGPAPVVQGSDIAMLSWFEMEDGVWGLGLSEPCANLKALQLKAALPAGAEVQLTSGSLLSQQAGPIFLRQIPGEGLDVSLAVLGEGLVISGQGLLFSVTLPAGVLPGDLELTARDAMNADLEFVLGATAVEDLPTVYRLAGNFPNPFNPKTVISFDLPEAQLVRLAVFSANGRRIATLLDAQMAAGSHSAVWDGRDEHGDQVASGVYFARIEAGPLNETHKMLLMK